MRTVQTELRFPACCVVSDETRLRGCVAMREIVLEERVEEGVPVRVASDDYTAKVTGTNVEMTLVKDSTLHPFTVVGLYPESHQRFCDHVEAENAEAAEEQVHAERSADDSMVCVCGVIAGHHVCLDAT